MAGGRAEQAGAPSVVSLITWSSDVSQVELAIRGGGGGRGGGLGEGAGWVGEWGWGVTASDWGWALK